MVSSMKNELQAVLKFWFEELTPEDWYSGSAEIDEQIREKFADTHVAVVAGEYWKERVTPETYLAEVIVLDQFSRNKFRDTRKAFAFDDMALCLAQHAIAAKFHEEMTEEQKQFLYMPFMHSESKQIHETALVLFESLGNEESLKFEKIHKDIIDRFGRYPHRNETLGRDSTPEEIEYLANNEESFF